jgi:hypothetical protein
MTLHDSRDDAGEINEDSDIWLRQALRVVRSALRGPLEQTFSKQPEDDTDQHDREEF